VANDFINFSAQAIQWASQGNVTNFKVWERRLIIHEVSHFTGSVGSDEGASDATNSAVEANCQKALAQ